MLVMYTSRLGQVTRTQDGEAINALDETAGPADAVAWHDLYSAQQG
jgi:hypothetical protein